MKHTRVNNYRNNRNYSNRKITIYDLFYPAVSALILFGAGLTIWNNFTKPHDGFVKDVEAQIIRPTVADIIQSETPTPTPSDPLYEQIKAEIYEEFGEDGDRAMQLLSCENGKLNPVAVNTAGNEPPGSRDIGIFQVNEYWQEVNPKFLFNWKTNIAIAHQIYTDSGNSFHMWTCGKKLGI